MRRRRLIPLLVPALAIVLAPAVALAAPPEDGTLAVRDAGSDVAPATVLLDLSGTVVAQVDKGRIAVSNLGAPGDVVPVVTGEAVVTKDTDGDGTANVYVGRHLKLRATGGHYRIGIWGSGVDLNAVGHGKAKLAGTGGWYSTDGSAKAPLPALIKNLPIGS
jgi:hypothetical protein